MTPIEDDKVVPFKKKKTVTSSPNTKPPNIDWAASSAEDALFERALTVVNQHSNNLMDIIAEYMRQNEIVDPSKLTADQFKDMTLIKESLNSLMMRVVGFNHALHNFIEDSMEIPDTDGCE